MSVAQRDRDLEAVAPEAIVFEDLESENRRVLVPRAPVARSPLTDSLGAAGHITRSALVVVILLSVGLVAQVAVISSLQHRSAQVRAFAKLRGTLAQGTAPLGQADTKGHLLALGTPIAVLDIPAIHVHQVVEEGTTAGVLMSGPGHRRDTALPGQAGTSVLFGRAAAYGGPFRHLNRLHAGAKITVITGQGTSTYKVAGLRHDGDKIAPLAGEKGRLSLATARGGAFTPTGVEWVDADLTSATLPSPAAAIAANSAPRSEQPNGTDTSTVWALVFWLQGLLVVAVGGVLAWHRWGHHQTWIVFAPLGLFAGLGAAGQVVRLLPNLL